MKKIEVLQWGLQHIAGNYRMGAHVDYKEDGQMCIYVTEEHQNVTSAPLNDVQMLCEDLGIPREYVEPCREGIDVYLLTSWVKDGGMLLADYVPTGMEFWVKRGHTIGS